jgi:hypothetical protein
MSVYTGDRPNPTSNAHGLTDAELETVNGGLPTLIAYVHSVFIGSASDLVTGGKGFVAEAAYDAAMGVLRGH